MKKKNPYKYWYAYLCFLSLTQIKHTECQECIYCINLDQQHKYVVETNNNIATNTLLIEQHATIQ